MRAILPARWILSAAGDDAHRDRFGQIDPLAMATARAVIVLVGHAHHRNRELHPGEDQPVEEEEQEGIK